MSGMRRQGRSQRCVDSLNDGIFFSFSFFLPVLPVYLAHSRPVPIHPFSLSLSLRLSLSLFPFFLLFLSHSLVFGIGSVIRAHTHGHGRAFGWARSRWRRPVACQARSRRCSVASTNFVDIAHHAVGVGKRCRICMMSKSRAGRRGNRW